MGSTINTTYTNLIIDITGTNPTIDIAIYISIVKLIYCLSKHLVLDFIGSKSSAQNQNTNTSRSTFCLDCFRFHKIIFP